MFYKTFTAIMLGVAWGLSVILMKFAARTGIEFFQIIFTSTIGVAITLYFYLKFQNKKFVYSSRFLVFGLVCGVTAYLIPEYFSLMVLKHITAGLLSIVLTTAPIFTYAIALLTKEDEFKPRKILGLLLGLVAVLILLISREKFSIAQINTWLLVSFFIAVSYAVYDVYASTNWPKNYQAVEVAYGESVFVGILALPFVLFNFEYQESVAAWQSGYWIIILLIALWSVERILFFTAIKKGGAVYAAQAAYIAPPVSIILGMIFFAEPFEVILWVCLGIILIAVTLVSSVSKHSENT